MINGTFEEDDICETHIVEAKEEDGIFQREIHYHFPKRNTYCENIAHCKSLIKETDSTE